MIQKIHEYLMPNMTYCIIVTVVVAVIAVFVYRITFAKRVAKIERDKTAKIEKLRNEFIANISHELRTPLTVLLGTIEALNDGIITDDKKTKECYAQMLNEGKGLQRLTNDLLELSRLQNTDFEILKEDINLSDVLDDVIRSSRFLAGKRNIEIVYNKTDIQQGLIADYSRIRQMLLIIIDNAVKFSPDGSQVIIDFSKNTIRIIDRGIGISQEELPQIFNKFHKSRDEFNKQGTGLGLTIAKKIAERHNIGISVESKLNIGTTFSLTFPDF